MQDLTGLESPRYKSVIPLGLVVLIVVRSALTFGITGWIRCARHQNDSLVMDFYLQYNRLYIQGPFPTFLTQNTVAAVVMEERLICYVRHIPGVTVVMLMVMVTMVAMVMFLWRCRTS